MAGGGAVHPLRVESGERNKFLNFQVKVQGFVYFCCEKLYLWPETMTGGGAESTSGG